MPHDYKKDKNGLHRYIDDALHNSAYNMDDAAKLGGAVVLADYLNKKHAGELKLVKYEIKRAVDYLYYYETTKNPLYKKLADDAVMHVKQICEDIEDPADKEAAYELIREIDVAIDRLSANI